MSGDNEPEMEAVFAEVADEEMRSIFSDGVALKQFRDLILPAPLRRFLRRADRGEARPWDAERPLYEAKRATARAGQELVDGQRQDGGRLMVRMMLHPRYPDLAERVFQGLALRAARRARDNMEARRIVAWVGAIEEAHPDHAPAILQAVWDIDKAQREDATKLWNALEPLDGADAIAQHLAVRRVLNTFHQVAELGYRPYASTLFQVARTYEPNLPRRDKFGGFVKVLREHLDQRWPKYVSLVDPDVVFLRNAAAHPELETLFASGRYRLRDNPGMGRTPTVREYTYRALAKKTDWLVRYTMPDGAIHRAAECLRMRAFVKLTLSGEIAKLREAITAHRDELTRFAAGEDVPGIFTYES